MYRYALIGCGILFLSLNLVMADTIRSKIKAVDDEKRTVTFEVDGKDKTFPVSKDAKIFTVGKAKKGTPAPEVTIILSATANQEATITTDKVNGKDTVTAIKIDMAKKKKKKTT